MKESLKTFLDEKVAFYNRKTFIENDPISIPYQFTKHQDIEISGFFAAVLAWGQRKTIIRKCSELMILMDNAPHEFITTHTDKDLKPFLKFKHRTFQPEDLLYFLYFLKSYYRQNDSLQYAFSGGLTPQDENVEPALIYFHDLFFASPYAPLRTRKHIATPAKKAACKRLNMFLRWMVRKDNSGVDFGIWNNIRPGQLICPMDVHVARVARKLELLTRKQNDWQAAEELTANLKQLDHEDPVKYDFALFNLGIEEKF